MKKLLALSILFASMMIFIPSSEAQAATVSATQTRGQIRREIRQDQRELRRDQRRYNRYNRGVRYAYQTRYVRSGNRLYKYTYRVKYLPNGRTQTTLVSRVRVR